MISEKLPADVKMANTSKDLIISLSMSFISNLAAKANTICSEHNKKTIIAEHVFEAMYSAKQTHLLGPILD
jgi:histone H3/H4